MSFLIAVTLVGVGVLVVFVDACDDGNNPALPSGFGLFGGIMLLCGLAVLVTLIFPVNGG